VYLNEVLICSYQRQYKVEAMRGLGIDRHLFGLYLIANGLNIKPFPKLFKHKVYLYTVPSLFYSLLYSHLVFPLSCPHLRHQPS